MDMDLDNTTVTKCIYFDNYSYNLNNVMTVAVFNYYKYSTD